MHDANARGHAAALFTIVIWGTTFVSTKVLLDDFRPIEILFFRFALGLAALALAFPRRLRGTTPRQELTFAAAGFAGVCLYYLLENVALTFTLASNVGIILSVAPLFTALLSRALLPDGERLHARFFCGLAVAMAGVAIVSLNGASFSLNPRGDMLALSAAFAWAVYSVLTRKIASFGHPTALTTRRTFCYGLLFMLPFMGAFGFQPGIERFADPVNALNMLFLGLGASALCFVTWNFAVKALGAVKTSVYIYLNPVVTTVTSAIVLHEPVTWMTLFGIALTVVGLALSERRTARRTRSGTPDAG